MEARMWLALALGCAQTILLDRPPAPEPVGCEGPTARRRFEVTIPAREPGCAWGRDGNLDPVQGWVTARAEDHVALDLGDVEICDVSFDFGDQTIEYDDAFFLTFGDVVLASSYAPMVEAFEADGMLRLYDWARLAGHPFSFDGAETYCVGAAEGLASCTVPPAETPGPLALAFEGSLVRTLADRAADQGYGFGFVTVGDNDPVDCSHTELVFAVEVEFVEG